MACALAGGKGEDDESGGEAGAPASSTTTTTSTFPNARGHSHSVCATLSGDEDATSLELVVSWLSRETGDQARARLSLRREQPEKVELEARRAVVSLALASARAAGAAAAELAAQNSELAAMAERAQAEVATGDGGAE